MKRLIIFGSIALGLMCCIQIYWFTKAFDAKARSFDHQVSAALFAAADTMSENVRIEKRAANYFYVNSHAPFTSKTVDTLIQKEMAASNISLDYEIGVYNAADDSLIHVTQVKSTTTPPGLPSKVETDGIQKNFAVIFPSRRNFLLGQSDALLFCISFLTLMSWAIAYWLKRTKATTAPSLIRLGNCSLDFHNQQLSVGKTAHQLTHKENQILKLFFEKPNQVIQRKVFLETVWEQEGFFVARSMDVFISKIRKYLKPEESIKIENLRAIGYRLNVKKK